MSSFHAEIITHPDTEMLIYLRYLVADKIYDDVFNDRMEVDYKTEQRLRKSWLASRDKALKEIIK